MVEPTKLNPCFFKSLLIKSESSVRAGSSFNVLNLLLIPKFAHQGAAIVMTTTESYIFVVCLGYVLLKITHLQELVFIVKALVASMCMGIVLFVFHTMNLFFAVIVGGGTYFLVLYLLKGFTIGELLYAKRVHFNAGKIIE